MPPKKVPPPPPTTGAAIATGDEGTPSKQDAPFRDGINIEDLNLPKSIVTRLAKGVLPPNTQIQGNAMLAMTKSATVFVNYIASQANEYAAASNRKTIAPQDVFAALNESQFADFKPRLEAELAKFNETQAEKRNASKSKAANKTVGQSGAGEDGEGDSMMDREGQPASKKARLDPDDSAMDISETTEGYSRADHGEDEEGDDAGDETEEDEEGEGDEERLEVEEQEHLEEPEEPEDEDEALDNGDDSE